MMPETQPRKVRGPEQRNLTDADVAAIVVALRKEMTETFYKDFGRGVWGILWKVSLVAIATIAAYGQIKGIK